MPLASLRPWLPPLLAMTLALALPLRPAWASSTASSVASDAGSASVGSLSHSLEASSASSTGGRVAQGDYRIVDVAEAPARPGELRLTLAADGPADAPADDAARDGAAPAPTVALWLPRATAERAGLAAGGRVAVRQRPYGLEFAAGTPRTPFFLVLEDAWHQGLGTRPVAL